MPFRHRIAGERGLLVEVSDNGAAHQLAGYIRETLGALVEEVVPGHDTVLIVGRDQRPSPAALSGWAPTSGEVVRGQTVSIDVRYDGPDLGDVAVECAMSPEEVVARHQAATYTVAFIGFAAGFAYLVGGDPKLRPSRLAHPRPRVEAGSLAVAGEYSAVYPRDSPGGWRLIGSTTLIMFDPERASPTLVDAGDTVHFVARDRV